MIFADEIHAGSEKFQESLLRTLETRLYCPEGSDVEIPFYGLFVGATNLSESYAELLRLADRKEIRADFIFRFRHHFDLPRLSQRADEIIPILASLAIAESGASAREHTFQFTSRSLQVLLTFGYPGNVRQLTRWFRNLSNGQRLNGDLISLEHMADFGITPDDPDKPLVDGPGVTVVFEFAPPQKSTEWPERTNDYQLDYHLRRWGLTSKDVQGVRDDPERNGLILRNKIYKKLASANQSTSVLFVRMCNQCDAFASDRDSFLEKLAPFDKLDSILRAEMNSEDDSEALRGEAIRAAALFCLSDIPVDKWKTLRDHVQEQINTTQIQRGEQAPSQRRVRKSRRNKNGSAKD